MDSCRGNSSTVETNDSSEPSDEDEKETDDAKHSEDNSSENTPKKTHLQVSLDMLVRNFIAVEENRIWKTHFFHVYPSAHIIQNEHFYCFKKLYLQRNKQPSKIPVFVHRSKVKDLVEKLKTGVSTVSLQSLISKDTEELYLEKKKESNSEESDDDDSIDFCTKALQHHRGQIYWQLNKLSRHLKRMKEEVKKTEKIFSYTPSNRQNKWEKLPTGTKHTVVFDFLRRTAMLDRSSSTDPDPVPCNGHCTWYYEASLTLLSPVNAKSAYFTFSFSVSGSADDHCLESVDSQEADVTVDLQDVVGSDIKAFDFQSGKRDIMICPKKLWQVTTHLGLDTLCSSNQEKMEFVNVLWNHVVFAKINPGSDFESIMENIAGLPEIVHDHPPTAIELFKSCWDKENKAADAEILAEWEALSEQQRQELETRAQRQAKRHHSSLQSYKEECNKAFSEEE